MPTVYTCKAAFEQPVHVAFQCEYCEHKFTMTGKLTTQVKTEKWVSERKEEALAELRERGESALEKTRTNLDRLIMIGGKLPQRLTDESNSIRFEVGSICPEGGYHQRIIVPLNDKLIELETGGISMLSFPFSAYGTAWLMADTGSLVLPIPTPHCAFSWSQLYSDTYANVAGGPTDPPNRVRSEPSTNGEIIHQIYPGTIVKVLEGPVCADGLVFWKVENGTIPGGSGWTAEGDGIEYYLEPHTP